MVIIPHNMCAAVVTKSITSTAGEKIAAATVATADIVHVVAMEPMEDAVAMAAMEVLAI